MSYHPPHEKDSTKHQMDDSLGKTKEIVCAVQALQKQQEELEQLRKKEARAHQQTKERMKQIEVEHLKAREEADTKVHEHLIAKERLEKEERSHGKTRDSLQASKDDVASMRLQLEAMKVEMEAQRKAFVVNVNWAARCTELKTKCDQSREDYDRLMEQHVQTKQAMDAALRAQEEYRMKYDQLLDAYNANREDVARLQEDLAGKSAISDDVAKKLEELDKFKGEAAAAKIKGNQKVLSVLQRSMGNREKGLTASVFTEWSFYIKNEKNQKMQKEKAMQRATRMIASEGAGLLATVIQAWKKDAERTKRLALEDANSRLKDASGNAGSGAMASRARAIAQLEKQFLNEDSALVRAVFGEWAKGRIERRKKEQGSQKAARMMANSANAMKAEVFMLWNGEAERTRTKKTQKEGNNRKALRMIANSGKQLTIEIFQIWWGWIEKMRRDRKKKEAGTAKAMRMMAANDKAMMNLCFDSWAKLLKEAKKKSDGNKRAMRMIADGGNALLNACIEEWYKIYKASKDKDKANKKAARMIAGGSQALVGEIFEVWSTWFKVNKDKNKKMRAVEKTIGASAKGLQMLVVTSWHTTASDMARQKRAKEKNMARGNKAVGAWQELLLCQLTLFWARDTKVVKLDKAKADIEEAKAKVAEAEDAARVAIEQDLGKAQEDLAKAMADLEAAKKKEADATGKLEGVENRLYEESKLRESQDKQIDDLTNELEDSRKKAKDIGDELAKVGIFLQSVTPRKGKNSRPGSGAKNERDGVLPRIDGGSRPMSGARSARGDPKKPPSGAADKDKAKMAWTEEQAQAPYPQ
mmetsp:Transcript_80831/g.143131  ORF Transcript_80831/g.143131 Transcript_80831/m.143131 type:complete len:812 (-) Transcript_80831:139-2574(-)